MLSPKSSHLCSALLRVSVFAGAAPLAAACGPSAASEIDVGPETLSFRGTSTATLEVEANGSWVAQAEPGWLRAEVAEGSGGQESMTITVDRDGLDTGSYDGEIVLEGDADTRVTVPVTMRFPELGGSLDDTDDHIAALRRAPEPSPEPGEDYVPGEIVVGLDRRMVALTQHGDGEAEISSSSLQQTSQNLAASVGAKHAELMSPDLAASVMTVESADVSAAIEAIERDGRARYAQPNYYYETNQAPANDEHYDLQWHYENIRLEEAWDVTTGYEDVEVAVIDADFYPDHPDLQDNLLPGWNFVDDSDDILVENPDCGSHGTHVAGTVGAVTGNDVGVAGVSPNLRILPLNVAPRSNGCGLTGIGNAIAYAAGAEVPGAGQRDEPVDVINMSLGGDNPDSFQRDAVEFAHDQGVTVVAAAGNTDPGEQSCDVGFPAGYPEAIAVGATDQFDEIARYSCTGPEVTVAAPGGDTNQELSGTDCGGAPCPAGVLSTEWLYDQDELGYWFKNGTSMASPHVAGVAALIRSVNPDLSPDDVADILINTSVDLGSAGHDSEYGHGLIDAAAAVEAARDGLTVSGDDLVVRLYRGEELLSEAEPGAGGTFDFGSLAAGEYRLVAGSLRDGELDVPGTVYGEQTVNVSYDGDIELDLPVTAR